MGIFNFLKNKEEKKYKNKKLKDQREAKCPNCNKELDKVPGAKTKCPHCEKYMYVRTTPNKTKVVVSKKEADEIDKEWRIKNGTQKDFLAKRKRFKDRKEELAKKFNGKKPADSDVNWSLLNEDLINSLKNNNLGLYRNKKLEMAEILQKENKLKDALMSYLGICFLDLNGPINITVEDNENKVERFDPDLGSLAPAITKRIKRILKKLEYKEKQVKKLYYKQANRIQKTTNAPLDPDEVFKKIKQEIL